MTVNTDTERVPYGLAVHDHEEENAVLEIIRNHKTIMGEKVKQFENEIAVLFGKKFGVMVNSGSSANLLAMELLDCPKNSEVITPILTFATTLSPILKKELIPVFVDVVWIFKWSIYPVCHIACILSTFSQDFHKL